MERERKCLPSRSTALLLPILLSLGMSSLVIRPLMPTLIKEFFEKDTNSSHPPLPSSFPLSPSLSSSSSLSTPFASSPSSFSFPFWSFLSLPSSSFSVETPSCEEDGYSQAASISSSVDAVSAGISFAVSALLGGLSDALGRKPILLWSIFLFLLTPVCLLVFENNLWFYFGVRILQGFSGSSTNILASSVLLSCCADNDIYAKEQKELVQQQQLMLLLQRQEREEKETREQGNHQQQQQRKENLQQQQQQEVEAEEGQSFPHTTTTTTHAAPSLTVIPSLSTPLSLTPTPPLTPSSSTHTTTRTLDMAWLSATTALVLIFSPLISSLFSSYLFLSNTYIFVFSLICAVFSFSYTFFLLPEPLPLHRRKKCSVSIINPFAPFKLLKHRPMLSVLCFVYFLSALPENGVVEVALLYCDDVLGLKGIDATNFNASLYIVCGVTMLFTLTVGIHSVLRYVSEHSLMVFGFVLNAGHMAGYALTKVFPYKATMYVTEVIYAFCGPGNVALTSMASHSLLPSEVGLGMGCLSAIGGMNGAFGPLAFGWLYSSARCPPLNFPEAPFFLGVVMGLSAAVVTIFWVPRTGPKAPVISEASEPLLPLAAE